MADSTLPADPGRGTSLIIASILLGSCAQLVIKLGMNHLPPELQAIPHFPASTILLVALGLAAYGTSMLLWMVALARHELSFAYPMLSTSYILVYLGAILLPQLDETVSLGKSIGIALIVLGVVFVTRSRPGESAP